MLIPDFPAAFGRFPVLGIRWQRRPGAGRTVSPFISERPTLFCRYGIMFLMIVAHGTDVSGSYGGHTEAVEATQRL